MSKYAMSRRRLNIIFIACVFFLITLVCLDRAAQRKLSLLPAATQQSVTGDIDKYHGKKFMVTKVVDGDTIDINIPDGNYPSTRLRLWGVDTPETKHPTIDVMYFGPEASDFVKQQTYQKIVTIYLDTGNDTRGKSGRLLTYVQLPDGTFLNERLLSEGYAYADRRFKHSLYNKYNQLESAARSSDTGLWANVQQDQLPGWLQSREPNLIRDW